MNCGITNSNENINRYRGNCNVSNCKLTCKKISRLQRDLKPRPLAVLTLQCSTNWAMKTHTLGAGKLVEFQLPLRWSWTFVKFVFPQFTSSSCFNPLTGKDELTKLACSQRMGLHSSTGREQCQHRGHGFESHWSPHIFFSSKFAIA